MKLCFSLICTVLLCSAPLDVGAQNSSIQSKPSINNEANSEIDSLADEFLRDAPRQNADALSEYQAKFEGYGPLFAGPTTRPGIDFERVYCRAAEKNPQQALDIIYVIFGGSADGWLPRCNALRLDEQIPAVKQWVAILKKKQPRPDGGTIVQSEGRGEGMALLAAAMAPDYIAANNVGLSQEKLNSLPKSWGKIRDKELRAKAAIITFYQKKFGYTKEKAAALAQQNMKIIAWRLNRTNGFPSAVNKTVTPKHIDNNATESILEEVDGLADNASELCKNVFALVKSHQAETDAFLIPYSEFEAGSDKYLNIDLDEDGISDSIVRNRGYGAEKIQSLSIKLSNGKEMNLELSPFYIIEYRKKVLLIENRERIFLINATAITQICN